MSHETVSHSGKILETDPRLTTVEIIAEDACGACHAKGLCSVGSQVVKKVTVATPSLEYFEPGEEVWVDLRASMGHKAVWIAYVTPLLVLLAVILILLKAGVSEPVAGLAGIAAIAVYYFCVWLLRDRLRDQYVFTIRKKQ